MADRFWVGGTASWDATAGTKWATTSGGAGGASVPTSVDDVFFDSGSSAGNYTVTLTTSIPCRSINASAPASGTATFSGTSGTTNGLLVSGNFTISATGVSWGYTGTVRMLGTGSFSINTNAVSMSGNFYIDNASGTYSLSSAFTLTGFLAINTGTFTTNNYAVTAGELACENNSSLKAFNLGSSVITVSATNTLTLRGTNLTFNAGTSQINATGVTNTIAGNGVTFYNVAFTNTTAGTRNITGANTFNNLSVTAPSSAGVAQLTFNTNQTINGTLSTNGTAGNRRVWFRSDAYGVRRTLTVNGSTSLTDADFRDIIVNGTAAPISGTRIGNRGACVGITFDVPKTVYWNLAGAQNWSANGWATTSTGTPSTDNFPLPQDTATFTNAGSAGTVTFDTAIGYTGTVDMSGRTTAMTLNFNNAVTCYGSWINGSGTTLSNFQPLTFEGQGTKTITSAGKAFSFPVTFDVYGGTIELADAFTVAVNQNFTINNGTFDTKNFTLSCGSLRSNNSNVRTIKLGSSAVSLTSATTTAFDFSTTTNLTFDAGTSTISATNVNQTLNGGGLTFYDFNMSTRNATLNGSNTFRNFTLGVPASLGIAISFIAADQTITGTLTCSGSAANTRSALFSSVIGTPRTLTVGTLVASNSDLRDVVIAGTAAGTTVTTVGDCGGNSGIVFSAPKNSYRVGNSTNFYDNAWSLSSGGSATTAAWPLAHDTVVFDDALTLSGTLLFGVPYNVGTFDCLLRTNVLTINFTNSATFYGSFTLGSGITISGSGTQTFSGRGTQTITSAGKTITFRINVDIPTGTVQLGDSLNSSTGAAVGLNLVRGTFDAVTYNVTVTEFDSSNSNVRTLKMGSGLWTITRAGGSTPWQLGTITNLTFLKDTADIVLSDNTTTGRTFAGGGLSYNKLTIGGTTGTSTTTITGNNQFTELASTKTVAHTIALGTTAQTFGAWTVTGTAGNVVTLTGTSNGNVLAGSATSGIDYLAMGSVGFSVGTPSLAEFYAGANSTGTAIGPVFRTAPPTPRTLYWVGGTGNWTDSAKWSLSSGGSGGQPEPTSLDNVIFDSASNATAYTVTVNSRSRCNSLTIAGPASGNVTLAGSSDLSIHGNVTLPATGLTRTFTGAINLTGSTTGKTFTTNGVNLDSNITVNGVGCGWSLGSALTIPVGRTLTITNGSFDTSNYNVSCGQLVSNNSNSRTITLGSSTVNNLSSNPLSFNPSTNLTFSAGTSQINLAADAGLNGGSGQTFYNVSFTSTAAGTRIVNGLNTFNNLTVVGRTSTGISVLSILANQTINGTLTLSAGTNATMRTFVRSDTLGTTRTLTCNAVTATDVDFRDITIAGSAAPVSGTRLGDCKGNSGITFDAAKTVYYAISGIASWGGNSWSFTNGGSQDSTAFPLAQDTVVFPSSPTPYPASGNSVTINAGYNIGTIDMSARTSNTMTLATGSTVPAVYGNWINGTGVTLPGPITGGLVFAGRGSQTITSAGRTFPQRFTIDTPGGSVTLQDNFVVTEGTSITLNQGTFNANNFNVTLANQGVASAFASTGNGVRTVNMGSGTWLLRSFSTGWNVSGTNLTITGTARIVFDATNFGKTFAGGGFSYAGMTLDQGSAQALTITGNNTFGNIVYTGTGATTIALGSTTQRVGAFTATGTAGNILTITGNTSNLIYTGGGTVGTGVDYLNVQGRVYGPNGETSGIWYAGVNSVNSGSLGWEFTTGGSVTYNVSITEAYTSGTDEDTGANIFSAAATENSTLADVQVPAGVYSVSITENSDLADTSSPSFTLFVSVTEDTTLANFQEFVNLIVVSITEGSIAGDSQIAQNAFLVDITENSTLAEAAAAAGVFSVIAVENSVVESTQAAQAAFNTLVSEGFTPAAVQAASRIASDSITEGMTVADAEAAARAFLVSITEDFIPESTEAALRQLVGVIVENLNSAEVQTTQTNFNAAAVEPSTLADVAQAQADFNSAITEATNIADILDAIRVLVGDITENSALADTQNRTAIFARTAIESLASASQQAARANFNSSAVEALAVLEQQVGYGWFRVVDDQTVTWTNVNNTQSVTWSNVGNDQNPVWVEIDNNQP